MVNFNYTEEKVWEECKTLLDNLSAINNSEDFLEKENLVSSLYENLIFLKKLKDYEVELSLNEVGKIDVNQEEKTVFEELSVVVDETNHHTEVEELHEVELEIETPASTEIVEELKFEFANAKEEEFEVLELEESVANNEPQSVEEQQEENQETEEEISEEQDKKIKLAHIKGLSVQSLFDEETITEPKQEAVVSEEVTPLSTPSKPRQDFKLDFNDRLAFLKVLFDNSQVDMNEVIKKLNSFDNIEQAREYLSDVYYERNWGKVDEYAQRLWALVENKFL
ncbi:hypothetical protein J5295_07500 [Riemerella anatipestifer]|uniref:Uncharacterized protein n=1 Tax=Riemerella anatipestifer (strain ATCC 11845 / DSM 15868 / JCM 9532 / NCTC 11014) TaxID=693978 RepID=E4TAG2_RIEAD|nr:hypothetical protein [Riemerella anatipestifer]ADQ82322.1 hypothetical protein Riean_1162 [Riemerella anatipestifer ATCC 11845 = DSM 15868]ADZ12181.1 hypothetical protein RIA_1064 [Riemerella anatipestifer RA-GD]AFD56325.1 hypothetical protein RA0C_1430 [Riemerella anatipestifer ATCC 11845 = DSM 15868]AGC39749.1 hypothetical protein G148_0444 [Riemerella anatipestifer RA-CH-2]AKP71429.1 hypothetical protein CG09_1236 [Riemerella anatipestifer]